MFAAVLLPIALFGQSRVIFETGFEPGSSVQTWRTQTWSGSATFGGGRIGRTGQGISVTSETGADAAWTTQIPVRPFSKYRFSGWIKTENMSAPRGRGALFNLHARAGHTEPIHENSDWKEVGFEFDSGGDDTIQLNLLLGYHGLARGKATFDDIKLELLSTRTMNPQATFDASKTAEPISKYVYGQFIEHLGRCIYGGIWSEMLEDRKFFYLPGSKESPWTPSKGLEIEHIQTSYREQPVLKVKSAGVLDQGGIEFLGDSRLGGSIVLRGQGKVRFSLLNRHGEIIWNLIEKIEFSEFRSVRIRLEPHDPSDSATFRMEFFGPMEVASVSLMPADNVKGFRKDTLELLKKLDSPIYRWPGGNFVSAYDWRDGVGDRDRRPTRKNPAWQGIDSNDVGIHEFLEFCDLIKTEPLIVVNTGFGDAHSAMQHVEYVNGAASTEQGAKRAKNGRRAAWGVKWWGVGNEMYGDWQHGHMSLNFYTQKHNDFARYMRRADPTIMLVGVGAAGTWSEGMLKECAANLDLLSEHFYTQERPSVMAHVAQVPGQVKRIAEAHRDYRKRLPSLKGRDIRIALDEWNYWYGPHVYGELGTVYFQKDALGIAAGLHEMFRNSDLYFMANYAQTVNVIGAIKTTKTKAAFDTTGMVLQKYRELFGTLPISVSGAPEPLDVAAALTADRKFLTIGIVNPMGTNQPLRLSGLPQVGIGTRWVLAGDPKAFNTPDKPQEVAWAESKEPALAESVTVKPHSVTLLVFPVN